MQFVDTNYFLRFFLKESGAQQDEARQLFESGARGIVKLCTSIIVFFEVYWVATSFYGLQKEKVASFLRNILKLEFIALENRELLARTLMLYEDSSLDLEDSYNLIYAKTQNVEEFKTFDAKLKKKFISLRYK